MLVGFVPVVDIVNARKLLRANVSTTHVVSAYVPVMFQPVDNMWIKEKLDSLRRT
jgi:hypothetical protein